MTATAICAFLVVSAAAAAADPPKSGLVKASPIPELTVENNTAVAFVHICHVPETAPIKLTLSVSDFTTSGANPYPLGTSTAFSPDPGELREDQCVVEKLTISGLWQFGRSHGMLYNAGKPIAKLCAVKYHSIFDVKPLGDKPEVIVTRGQKTGLILQNNDDVAYPVHWELIVDDLKQQGNLVIGPKGTEFLTIKPDGIPELGILAAGTLGDNVRDARLVLSPGESFNSSPKSVRTFPLKIRLRYWPRGVQQLVNTVCIYLILLFGAMVAWALYFGLSNWSSRNGLRKRLKELRNDLDDSCLDQQSPLRAALRVECRRLNEAVKAAYWFSPDFAAALPDLTAQVSLLADRIHLAARARFILDKLDRLQGHGLPPSRIDLIIDKCRDALTKLAEANNTADVDAVRTQIAEAAQLSHWAGQHDDQLEQAILKLENDLNGRIPPAAAIAGTWADLRDRFGPDLFDALRRQIAQNTPAPPAAYAQRDLGAQQLERLRRYVECCDCSDKQHQGRMSLHVDAFVKKLCDPAWDSVRVATGLLEQMEQDTYSDELLSSLKNGPTSIHLVCDRSVIHAFEVVEFAVLFSPAKYNGSEASRSLRCDWDFGHNGLVEKDGPLVVSHFFPGRSERYNTTATLLGTTSGLPVMVRPRQTRGLGPNARQELGRTLLLLLAPLLAIYTMAQQQLASLDLLPGVLTLFLLGFATETVKNTLLPGVPNIAIPGSLLPAK